MTGITRPLTVRVWKRSDLALLCTFLAAVAALDPYRMGLTAIAVTSWTACACAAFVAQHLWLHGWTLWEGTPGQRALLHAVVFGAGALDSLVAHFALRTF